MSHTKCDLHPLYFEGWMSSCTLNTNVNFLWLFAFVVKNICCLGMKQQSPFFHHFCQGFTFQFGCSLEPSRHKQYQRLLRPKREVQILVSAYKDVNLGWHLFIPSFHMVLSMWISSLSGWWPLTPPLRKTARKPFACLSFPAWVGQQWFERGKLKCLM